VIVTNRRDHGGGEGFRLKRSARRSASHSTASSRRGMRRDSSCLFRGAAWEQLRNGLRHACHQFAVLFPAAHIVTPAPGGALLSVGLAFFFGALKRRYLGQDALAFVAAAGPAETNNDRRKTAVLFGTTRKGSITSEEVLQVIEISTAQAQCSFPIQEEELTLPNHLAATRALRIAEDLENNQVFGNW
jgi:hypothetical protein